jgi:hypothetical protein
VLNPPIPLLIIVLPIQTKNKREQEKKDGFVWGTPEGVGVAG